MQLKKLLTGVLIAATAAVSGCSGSIRTSGGGVYASTAVVYDPPPAPRVVISPAPRAGFVYIQGRWVHNRNGRWTWRDGYWERERVGYYYAPGRWTRRPAGGFIWVDGRWTARGHGRGRVIIR